MNRGLFHNSLVQQQMMQSSSCWSMNTFPLLPNSSSSPSVYSHYPQPASIPPLTSLNDAQDNLPESWSQLLLGGYMGEEEKHGLTALHGRKMENLEDEQLVYASSVAAHHVGDMEQEYFHGYGNQEVQAGSNKLGPWSQILQPVISSPRSCITTNLSRNMLNFTSSKSDQRLVHHPPDNSSECNSTATGVVYKKARVQGSSSAHSTFKVRKEKLGDRITALHQIVSPFGKTDTASVLLEAIGYIRFLQSQIEVLSSPYLSTASGNNNNNNVKNSALSNEGGSKKRGAPDQGGIANNEEEKTKKDLKSRGLCLVPVSFFLHIGSDHGADCWAPTLQGAF